MEQVNHPKHYKDTSLECIDVMRAMYGEYGTCYFCLCSAFKYMWRYKNKNGEEDLNKAEFYLNWVFKNGGSTFDTYVENLFSLLTKCKEEIGHEG